MQPITLQHVKNIYEYNRRRPKIRAKMVALKQKRTLPLGSSLLMTFENRDTVQYYIQEAVRAERALEESAVQQVIEMYTPLLPGPDELCGVIQLHIPKKEAIQSVLHRFQHLAQHQSVWFEINTSERVYATFDTDNKLRQPAYYARFQFSEHTREMFCNSNTPVSLVVRHDSYHAASPIHNDLREGLIQDLTEE